jgi:hypothetical protein
MARLVPADEEKPSEKKAKLVAAGDAPTKSNPILGDDPLRQIALGSRAVAKGALTPFMWGLDLPMMLRNQVFGTDYKKPSQWFDEALTAAGAPVPQTKAENVVSAINEGGAGAVSMGLGGAPSLITRQAPSLLSSVVPAASAPVGAATIPTGLIPTVRSGAIGAGASEYAKQEGLPLWVQMAAGIAAPAAFDMTKTGMGIIGHTMLPPNRTGVGASPYAESGRELIAANVLARNTTSPKAVIERLNADQTIVPGVNPRTAEAAQDYGMAQVDKLLQNTRPSFRGDVLGIEGANNRVMRDTLENAVSPQVADQASDAASRLTSARNIRLSNADPLDVASAQGIVNRIDGMMDTKLAISDGNVRPALQEVRKMLYDSKGELITSPDKLDAVRQYVSNMIAGNFDTPQNKFSKANQALRTVLDDVKSVIEKRVYDPAPGTPGFPGYTESLRQTSNALKPVEQRDLLLKLVEKSSSKQDILPGGEDNYRLLLSKLNSSLQNERMAKKVDRVLTDDQLNVVDSVVKELERGAKLTSMQKNRLGSDTFQNLSAAALFGRVLGLDLPPEAVAKAPDYVQKMMGWIANFGGKPQERVMSILEEAMKDPNKARELLKKAPAANLESFAEAAARKQREYATGAGLGSTRNDQ